eukprot:4493476-Alexandrium_andersonii.AAC.1
MLHAIWSGLKAAWQSPSALQDSGQDELSAWQLPASSAGGLDAALAKAGMAMPPAPPKEAPS